MFCYCAASRRIARTLTTRYDAALAPAGLTAAQFETLSVLQALGPATGRALAAQLAVDKTTLSRNLKPMIEAGHITAAAGREDARQTHYGLTLSGVKKLQKARPLWQSVHDETAGHLGKGAASAQRTLQRMVRVL